MKVRSRTLKLQKETGGLLAQTARKTFQEKIAGFLSHDSIERIPDVTVHLHHDDGDGGFIKFHFE